MRLRHTALLLFAILGLIGFSACTVRLVSAYDEHVDERATHLQKSIDAFLAELARSDGPQSSFNANQQFYNGYDVELRALEIRARSQPKNDLTVRQIEKMRQSLGDLREAHEAGPLTQETIEVVRTLFSQAWQAIITLELAKKRGAG